MLCANFNQDNASQPHIANVSNTFALINSVSCLAVRRISFITSSVKHFPATIISNNYKRITTTDIS